MPLYQVTFYDGSIDEVEADDLKDARELAADLNEAGIQKIMLLKSDKSDEDDEPEEDDDE